LRPCALARGAPSTMAAPSPGWAGATSGAGSAASTAARKIFDKRAFGDASTGRVQIDLRQADRRSSHRDSSVKAKHRMK
jgi:hypothetical protein